MTSSACQSGERLLKTTTDVSVDRLASGLKVLPFEEWPVIERKNSEEISLDLSIVEKKKEPDQLADQQKSHEQARSGSSDSGQLSLLSSFGSLSIGCYQHTAPTSPYSTNPSSDSASRQSMSIVDIDQHHFYCSLMLLNSLELYQYKTQITSIGEANQHQTEVTKPQTLSLSLSSTGLTDSTIPESSVLHNSLQDCRWLAGNESAKQINQTGKEKQIKGSGDKSKKRGSGLSILRGDWRGQGAGKLLATAAAATNSSSFLDKLFAHMTKNNSASEGESKPRQQSVTMNDNKSLAKNSKNSASQRMKKETTQSDSSSGGGGGVSGTGSAGGLNLLTDLSRRLARRCGVKTKASPLAGNDGSRGGGDGGAQRADENGASLRGMSLKRNDKCDEKQARATSESFGATGCCAHDNELERAKVSSTASVCGTQGAVVSKLVKCSANNERNRSQFCDNNQQRSHHSILHSSDQAHQSKGSSISDDSNQSHNERANNPHPIQVQHEQSANKNNRKLINNNNNNSDISSSNLISSANLNASISTLGNCCCYCDNETCSSSGFVSSSTTGGFGGVGVGSVVSGGCDSSCAHGCNPSGSGITNCDSMSGSGNCGDLNTTTHSCNSSTHNDQQQVSVQVAGPTASSCSSSSSAMGRDIASLGSSIGPNSNCQFYCDHSDSENNIKDELSKQKEHVEDQLYLPTCEVNMTAVAAAAPTAPSPINVAANSVEPRPGPAIYGTTSLPVPYQESTSSELPSSPAGIQVFVAEDQSGYSHQDSKYSEVSSYSNHQNMKQQSGNVDTHSKPKPSLLSRARNSTINLASLATVTNRFSSASMGNLWHGSSANHGNHHHHHSNLTDGELADDSAEGGIRPLDYIALGKFDSYQPDDSTNLSPYTEPRAVKSASSNKLLGVGSCASTRKLSTKEKCKRQKEAERVEKLRLLVSYLKSGTSQPVVSPVALEADEIELAEKYKMHVIMRDDLLQDTQTSEHHEALLPSPQSGISITKSDNNADHKLSTGDQVDKVNKDPLINHSVGGTTTSSPTSSSSSSSSSMNHSAPQSNNDGRPIPHIGNVTWVLRHSISDPGKNNFAHSPCFSVVSSSSPSTRDHHHHNHNHHHHHSHLQNHKHRYNNPPEHDISAHQRHNNNEASIGQCHDHEICDKCRSCAPSCRSYSGSSLSNYCLGGLNSNTNNTKVTGSRMLEPSLSHNQQLPKLFYIDDTDPIPILSSSSPIAPTTFISSPTASTSAGTSDLPPSPSASAATLHSVNQPATPAVSDASVGAASSIDRNSSCVSTSAWTNPQNLAIWIDNEVNSLVHDLEAKSQQLKLKNESKHNKSTKRKWLSVTGHHSSRRSSAGANST